jgi:hypothetical protein
VRAAPSEGLASLLVRMWRDEGRLFRMRSGRAIGRGTRIVQSLGSGLDRALRSARQENSEIPVAQPAPVAERPAEPGQPP